MTVELRGGDQRDYSDRNIQYGGSRSVRRQERLPPGGIHGTRWADLDADVDLPPTGTPKQKTDYGKRELPSVSSLQELNTLDLKVVRQLVKSGKLDRLITDIKDLEGVHSNVLQIMFQHARAPERDQFGGHMRGIDLKAPHHDDTAFGRFVDNTVRVLQAWGGKQTTSRPTEGREGTGNNETFLGLGGLWLFEFNWDLVDTKLGKNLAGDGAKVIRLDYDAPNNALNQALGVDMIHDEIREIGKKGSGVMLGMAAIVDAGGNEPKGGFFRKAYSKIANTAWKGIYNFGLWLGGREERVGKTQDPIPFIYFGLQANRTAQS